MTLPNECKSMHAQSRSFAKCNPALDYRTPNDTGHDTRGRRVLRQGHGHQHADLDLRKGIRIFRHTLKHPITAEDLCTWLELLIGFAGTDLLQIKAIINVAGLPGPVLLHGEQQMLRAPQTLTRWPSRDRRTRIALVTRRLDEACLRELLGILTAASTHGRSQTPPIQPQFYRAAG